MSERSEGYNDGYAAGLRWGKREGEQAAAEAARELHRLQGRIREVKAEALKTAASILPEATEGIDRVGTSNWTARDRDIYSLAIEEAAGALLFRADRLESQETP